MFQKNDDAKITISKGPRYYSQYLNHEELFLLKQKFLIPDEDVANITNIFDEGRYIIHDIFTVTKFISSFTNLDMLLGKYPRR